MAASAEERIAVFIKPLRLKKKKDGVRLLSEGADLLCDYQACLGAQDTHGVLFVLRALDAAGRDGTIRRVMSGVNPQGVSVHSFNALTRAGGRLALKPAERWR